MVASTDAGPHPAASPRRSGRSLFATPTRQVDEGKSKGTHQNSASTITCEIASNSPPNQPAALVPPSPGVTTHPAKRLQLPLPRIAASYCSPPTLARPEDPPV